MRISKSTKTSVKASNKSDDTQALAARADFYRRELVKCGYTKEEVNSMGIKELRDAYNNCDIDACGDIKGCNASTSTDKALRHIRAAIDILGKSGKKDAITKDSIANLGVVYLDLNGKK